MDSQFETSLQDSAAPRLNSRIGRHPGQSCSRSCSMPPSVRSALNHSKPERQRLLWRARPEQLLQQCSQIARRKDGITLVCLYLAQAPPSESGDVLGAQDLSSEGAAGSEVVGLDQVVVIDDTVVTLCVTFGHDSLMPDMGWLVHQRKSDLFIQLPLKGLQRRLGHLDAATGSSPDDHALRGQVEPAQEYAI